MKKGLIQALSVALLGGGGVLALLGCEKAVQPEPNQAVARSAPQLVAAQASREATPAQAAWLRFVDQVERGEAVDPSGQYVAKGTKGAIDAAGHRSSRPKYDAATPAFAQHYKLRTADKHLATATTGSTTTNNFETPPEEPEPCSDCFPGGGPSVYSTFASSENQGGSGQIHDLKLVTGAPGSNSTSQQVVLGAPGSGVGYGSGYTLLNADLNKGAGGNYIYFCFQRDASNVLSGLEYYQGQPYSAPADFLTNFQTQNGSIFSTPTANRYFFDIWIPNQNPYYAWGTIDLNAGAGGEYIYSFQSKTPFVRQQSGGTVARPAFSEVGGDFIYFCYKF